MSGGMDGKLCYWGSSGSSCTDLCGHRGSVSAVVVNKDGSLALSAGYDKTLRLWNLQSKSEAMALTGHKAPILDLAWGRGTVVSGGRDGIGLLWDLAAGKASRKLTGHRGHMTVVSWNEEQGLFFTGAQDGHVMGWDARQKDACVCDLPLHVHSDGSGALAAIEGTHATGGAGGLIVTAAADNLVQVE